LSFQQFREWIKQHPKLYDSYYKGFHNYIWEYAEGVPLYSKNIPEKKSLGVRYVAADGKEIRVTAMLINTTLMLFTDKDEEVPYEIVCLDGLTVLPVDNSIGSGIQLTHKKGHYSVKTLFFSSKQ